MFPYKTPGAYKQALTNRIKERAKQRSMVFNRYQQLVIFDRFFDRIYTSCGDSVILKGGYVMELRLNRARTTKDIDFRGMGDVEQLLSSIRRAVSQVGPDFMSFEVHDDTSILGGEQIAYEGRRIRVQAMLAGKVFGEQFSVDISMGDALVLPPEVIPGSDFFEFVGFAPLQHRVYPKETHVAEKLHAYTSVFQDGRANSRAKDLVDLGLFATNCTFNAEDLSRSIHATFELRATHETPAKLPEPPTGWEALYQKIRRTDGLDWSDITEVLELVSDFLNPLLNNPDLKGKWDPATKTW